MLKWEENDQAPQIYPEVGNRRVPFINSQKAYPFLSGMREEVNQDKRIKEQ